MSSSSQHRIVYAANHRHCRRAVWHSINQYPCPPPPPPPYPFFLCLFADASFCVGGCCCAFNASYLINFHRRRRRDDLILCAKFLCLPFIVAPCPPWSSRQPTTTTKRAKILTTPRQALSMWKSGWEERIRTVRAPAPAPVPARWSFVVHREKRERDDGASLSLSARPGQSLFPSPIHPPIHPPSSSQHANKRRVNRRPAVLFALQIYCIPLLHFNF